MCNKISGFFLVTIRTPLLLLFIAKRIIPFLNYGISCCILTLVHNVVLNVNKSHQFHQLPKEEKY